MPGTPESAGESGSARSANGVLLAFDFGLRRIGVAVANVLTRTASPVATLRVAAHVPWQALDRIIAEWQPAFFLVGVPQDAAVGAHVTRFVAALEDRYGLAVETVDEALTSQAARAALRDARRAGHVPRKVGKRGVLDRHAARLIAEQWLRERRDAQ